MTASGRLAQINISNGGVPKLPIPRARVGRLGLEGDGHRNRRHHGGADRALCIFSLETIERLRADGHSITPGSTGENLTIAGPDFASLQPGNRLRIGDEVEIELTGYTIPCAKIAGSFRDGDYRRISQKRHPGDSRLYARVLQGGEITVGDVVQLAR